MARFLELGPEDNVVTIATDGCRLENGLRGSFEGEAGRRFSTYGQGERRTGYSVIKKMSGSPSIIRRLTWME
jgi:hypothetical protein